MIRVLHVVTKMDRGGLETMIMNYYRCMDRSKIQFDFLVHRNEKGTFDDEIIFLGGKIFRISRLNPFSIKYRQELNNFFNKNNYKIVHVHQDCMSSLILKYAYKNNIKYRIAHSHNANQNKNIKYLIKLYYKIFISKYSTHLFACGKEAGDWMFGNKEYMVLNNAINAKKFRFNEKIRFEKRERFGFSNKLIVVHVGRFRYQKNHLFLIDIFNELIKLEVNSNLLLIGDGEEKDVIMKKVSNLGLLDKVKFLGLRDDVDELLQVSDVFVLPSFYEGLPLASIEAQAAGLPCLISDTIPIECQKTNLVYQMSLDSKPKEWADKIIELNKLKRVDTYNDIIGNKFDILENAKWLSNFYFALYQS